MALDLEQLIMEGEEPATALVHPVEAAASQRGRLYTIPLSASLGSPFPGPSTPVSAEEKDWTIALQPQSLPYQWIAGGRVVGKQQQVIALIKYGAGGQIFYKFVQLTHTTERLVTVHARYIQVSFFVNGGTTAGDVVSVAAAIMPGSFAGPDKYCWTMAGAIDGARSGMIWQGAGQIASAVLGWLHVIMQTAGPAGLVYLVGCDVANAAAVVSGTTPVIAGFVSDPLTAIGATDVLSDDTAAGAIGWSNGLFIGLSTTTGVFTDAGAGTIHADLKAGQ